MGQLGLVSRGSGTRGLTPQSAGTWRRLSILSAVSCEELVVCPTRSLSCFYRVSSFTLSLRRINYLLTDKATDLFPPGRPHRAATTAANVRVWDTTSPEVAQSSAPESDLALFSTFTSFCLIKSQSGAGQWGGFWTLHTSDHESPNPVCPPPSTPHHVFAPRP